MTLNDRSLANFVNVFSQLYSGIVALFFYRNRNVDNLTALFKCVRFLRLRVKYVAALILSTKVVHQIGNMCSVHLYSHSKLDGRVFRKIESIIKTGMSSQRNPLPFEDDIKDYHLQNVCLFV